MGNNERGINSFSGPMGQKEPAYGTAERMKVLSKIGVKSPPSVNAPRRSQRRAGKGQPQVAAPEPQIAPEQHPIANYDQQLVQFWTQLAAEPGASPLIQQIAAQAAQGG